MKIVLSLFLLFPLTISAQTPDTSAYKVLDPYYFQLRSLITEPSMLIDVREPFEYKGRRVPGAVNKPSTGNIDRYALSIDTTTTIFLYCTTEYRSSRVATRLRELGFSRIFLLQGGITYWISEGYPTERGRIKKREKVREPDGERLSGER